jgi:2-polyprenyl-3-methyl-5-hydroxy-6-metoxy-1,4-benzoquinol methylase
MNRRERRAAVTRAKATAAKITASATPADIADLMAEAKRAYHQGQSAQAEVICKQIIERDPAHPTSVNLLGVINQASGRHRLAVKMFAKAIALDELDAAYYYNIASSYQALGEGAAATTHFKKAIILGLSDKPVEEFMMRNPTVIACVQRIMVQSSGAAKNQEFFGAGDIAAIANDVFIRCALEATIIRGVALELFLTHLRATLLRLAGAAIHDHAKVDDEVVSLFCAVAQQCFITEYVFAQSEEETQQASRLRDLLLQKSAAGSGIPPLLLAAVAAYCPLHALAAAKSLLAAQWPRHAADLLQRQVSEPLAEAADRAAIPALTAIDDAVSMQVMKQYEENPYPRWTINRAAVLAADMKRQGEPADSAELGAGQDILVAGCGTGQHAFDCAQQFPQARLLAIDISRTSLAYARRKTREEGLANIEYAQADILKLAEIGRSFDRIETMGVLHHLGDPKAGWRVLLSLLKPNGVMRIGLYSEAARHSVVEARAIIAERGYRATAEDIRAFRQMIIRNRDELRWKLMMTTVDFHNMSGCRDMLFNVMEHRFTIPEIATFLKEQGLAFLGFELDDAIVGKFQQRYPGAAALVDLDHWNAFEAANPQTFRHMYVFSVRRHGEEGTR